MVIKTADMVSTLGWVQVNNFENVPFVHHIKKGKQKYGCLEFTLKFCNKIVNQNEPSENY